MMTALIWGMAAAWLLMAVYGIFAYLTLEPIGSSFTRGSNRISALLGWQFSALVAAIFGFAIGRSQNAKGTMRLISRFPLWVSGGLAFPMIIFVAGFILYTMLTGS